MKGSAVSDLRASSMKNVNDDEAAAEESDPRSAGADDDGADESGRLLVAAGDTSAGTIGYDDLGQPRWTWVTELDGGAGEAAEDTFDYLKALDNNALAVEDEPSGGDHGGTKESGYDPYDTARIKVKGKVPWR